MSNQIEFARGDGNNHTFSIPASNWTAGGRLFFAAKETIDDDDTDSSAKIEGNWGDSDVTEVTIKNVVYKQYACYFPPEATNSILSAGAATATYLGEFQYVPTTGVPVTFPATGDKLEAIVYFDVKRKTTV